MPRKSTQEHTAYRANLLTKLADPETHEQALIDIGRWVFETCLTWGVDIETACDVTKIFASGLRKAGRE